MKRKSLIQTLTSLIYIQLVTMTILVVSFAALTVSSAQNRMDILTQNFLEIYTGQLNNRISKMDRILTEILNGVTDLDLLESVSETDRYYAAMHLRETLSDIMLIEDSVQMLMVAEKENGMFVEANNGTLPLSTREKIRDFVKDCAGRTSWTARWNFTGIGDKIYLYKIFMRSQSAVAAFVSVDSFLETIPDIHANNCSFVLADQEGIVQGYSGYKFFPEETGIPVDSLSRWGIRRNETSIGEGHFILYSFQRFTDISRTLQGGALLLLCGICLMYIFDFYFLKIVRRELIGPMGDMTRDMEHIRAGEYELRISEKSDNQEFSLLADTFNRLMDEILNLKIQSYETKLELSDAEQKYIRLQIRPHFFLNAMTTISSLSTSGRNEEIETYIQALSKNIRYMFSSGLHTVSVREEIRHVENYFEMQELKYPGSIFYYVELPRELEDWRIPQMILHTLVENEYKYAVSLEKSLMILIKISRVVVDGEELLLLEVEDDGTGYPEDVIAYINSDQERREEEGTRVGLWSIKRLMELMYDRKNLMMLSNVQPHGALTRIWIPENPVHERNREFMNEQGIR